MKTFFLTFTFLFIAIGITSAQLLEKEDGKYYDHNNQLFNGKYIEYYPSGEVQIEMNLVNGEKTGITTLYFKNGHKKEERSFKNNKMDGIWITWNEAGQKIAEASYTDGKKDGKWGIWDENGIQRYEMFYKQGKKTGTWVIKNGKGEITATKDY
ncbi:toxin-antitoxin system YwqK family antitoxin [Geofilum sp. OHC36d9]|uniref:toxin-antitoxin system YwqK family antitoxin n=1 Tax=Geofilum sp. OHC36d9 TaxID=3458413 RepID=UPI004034DCDD